MHRAADYTYTVWHCHHSINIIQCLNYNYRLQHYDNLVATLGSLLFIKVSAQFKTNGFMMTAPAKRDYQSVDGFVGLGLIPKYQELRVYAINRAVFEA